MFLYSAALLIFHIHRAGRLSKAHKDKEKEKEKEKEREKERRRREEKERQSNGDGVKHRSSDRDGGKDERKRKHRESSQDRYDEHPIISISILTFNVLYIQLMFLFLVFPPQGEASGEGSEAAASSALVAPERLESSFYRQSFQRRQVLQLKGTN